MKRITLFFLLSLFLLVGVRSQTTSLINLTPKPKSMTVNEGTLTLPQTFVVGYDESVTPEMVEELTLFVDNFSLVSGLSVSLSQANGSELFHISHSTTLTKEGQYTLNIQNNRVNVVAGNRLGLYYALQSIKKILPPCIMAGVRDASVTTFTLPCVQIEDEPRFEYRGFMLDVSRHFFTVEDVKRMIDVMSYYKMNRFHWHLSDDQGWRVEIKKYPRLTTVGSIAPNSRFTDMYSKTQYWINKPYGPYFYTQDQIREVVKYAQERHIEVVPEIDMPGHFVAAMTAYPEYSCWPNGSHEVWSDGGISTDVLNVANPQAVQFAKDILAELMELFPYEEIHIGGDECPTSAWEGNALCQAKYQELSLTSYRQLQSIFIKEMSDFVQTKGKKLAVWNEAITAGGADVDMVKSTDATVYCWVDANAAVSKASSLNLQSIFTPIGPYYINRRQGASEQDPPGAGPGTDDVRATYNQAIPAGTTKGIQGTFWCEHVSDRDYMEWLALPRLIAIAEAGWTPQSSRSFSDFQQRMTADTVLLNYGSYKYCKYHMLTSESNEKVMPQVSTNQERHYYRLISGATDNARVGRCMELLSANSGLLTTYAGNGAQANRLWTNAQANEGDANYDYQWWTIEQDPNNPNKYALVCKAMEGGSVQANPTATTTAGRWSYDPSNKHYNFQLGTYSYGQKENNYYYSILSDQGSNLYLNSSLGGQGFAVNVYPDPNDGKGGCWEFAPLESGSTPDVTLPFTALEQNAIYMFVNAVEGFNQTTLADDGTAQSLQHSTLPFANNAWRITKAEVVGETQTIALQNVATNRYISTLSSYVNRQGFGVKMGTASADITLKAEANTEGELRLVFNSKSLFPLAWGEVNAGSTIQNATYDAPRLQGATWKAVKAKVYTFVCADDQGQALGTFTRTVPVDAAAPTQTECPEFKGMAFASIAQVEGESNTFRVVYTRNKYIVTYRSQDKSGALLPDYEVEVNVSEPYTVTPPTLAHFTLLSSDVEAGTVLNLTADQVINCIYTTDAIIGVKSVADVVTTLPTDGKSYLFYDATTASGRMGFRRIIDDTKAINKVNNEDDLDVFSIWQVQKVGTSNNVFKVQNPFTRLFVPQLASGATAYASASGESFTFNPNADGQTWNLKGTNGMYWDGESNGDLVGWGGGTGHPIKMYTFYAQPMYTVTIHCVDASNTTLLEQSFLLDAGTEYTPTYPTIEGYRVSQVKGLEDYANVLNRHLKITILYTPSTTDGIESIEQENSLNDSNAKRNVYCDAKGNLYIYHKGMWYNAKGMKTQPMR